MDRAVFRRLKLEQTLNREVINEVAIVPLSYTKIIRHPGSIRLVQAVCLSPASKAVGITQPFLPTPEGWHVYSPNRPEVLHSFWSAMWAPTNRVRRLNMALLAEC